MHIAIDIKIRYFPVFTSCHIIPNERFSSAPLHDKRLWVHYDSSKLIK